MAEFANAILAFGDAIANQVLLDVGEGLPGVWQNAALKGGDNCCGDPRVVKGVHRKAWLAYGIALLDAWH